MKISVLDASTLGDDLSMGPLMKLGDVTVYQRTLPDELVEHTRGADVLILNKVKINETLLPDSDRIKLICIAATGFDNVDDQYCKNHGIALCNVKGYSSASVAQVTIAMALYLACHIKEYTEYVEDGSYTESGVQNCLTPVYHELKGKKWGLVGCGNIGSAVANAAKALGCEVCVFKRSPHPEFVNMDIDVLVKECDIISVHTPLNEETKNLINRERIFSMKKDAILINVARGRVCDEEALCDAIKSKAIGAVGIDVYSAEPFGKEHPYNDIMHLPNVCLTPHMAWGAAESRERCLEEIIKNIEAFTIGEKRNRIV